MRRLSFIALLFLSAYGYAQFPMVGSGRAVYRPDQVDSLFYWFDAQDLATITTTNNKVTAWADKGPFGYDVVQADTSKAPTYSATSGPGGSTAALTFDGTDDFLASAAHWWGSDDLTVFVVMKFGNATRDAAEIIISKQEATGDQRQWNFFGSQASGSYAVQFRPWTDGTVANHVANEDGAKSALYYVDAVTSNGAGAYSWHRNGASQTVTSTIINTGDHTIFNSSVPRLGIGAQNVINAPSAFLRGSISEIIVFSRALTNVERQGIEAYLSSKYDLALQNKQKPPVISNRRIQPDYIDSLFYWFDAMDASSLLDSVGGAVANNEGVATWADKSGRNWDVTQGTNTARPVYKATGGPGGNTPAVQFDGTNDFLASAAHWWGSDDLTVFVVSKWTAETSSRILIDKYSTVGNKRQWRYYYDAAVDSMRLVTSVDGTAAIIYALQKDVIAVNTWKLQTVSSDGSAGAFYLDGSSINTGTTSAISDFSTNKLGVGCAQSTDGPPVAFLEGSISEIIVYSRALTDSERVGVEQYLKQKWGL